MTTAALPPAPHHPQAVAALPTVHRPHMAGRAWGQREWMLLRWGVRAALVLGVAASVMANILHAQANPISQAIAAWPPLALLFTVELIARVPVHRRALAAARLLAATAIAGIAAFVSYWHMVGVAARYGETGASPYLMPLSVDGLIIVASISLVEISGRLHTVTADPAPADSTPAPTPAAGPTRAPDTLPPEPRSPRGDSPVPPLTASSAAAPPTSSPMPPHVPTTEPSGEAPTGQQAAAPEHPQPVGPRQATQPAARPTSPPAPTGQPAHAPERNTDAADDHDEVPTAPRDAIIYWLRRQPELGVDELAERIGKSPRQTRRYLDTAATNAPKVNGLRNDAMAATFRSETS